MSILLKNYVVEMQNGEKWAIPVSVIAEHRAKHYAHEFENNLGDSLKEDTVPLFESDDFEIEDWAKNNMNWSDVKEKAILLSSETDYQDGWVNGEVEILSE